MSYNPNSFQVQVNENLPAILKAYVPDPIAQPQYPTEAIVFQQSVAYSAPGAYSIGSGHFTLHCTYVNQPTTVNAIEYYVYEVSFPAATADVSVYNGFAIYKDNGTELELVVKSTNSDAFLADFIAPTPALNAVEKFSWPLQQEVELGVGKYYIAICYKIASDPSTTSPSNLVYDQNITTFTTINNTFYKTVMVYKYVPGNSPILPSTINISTDCVVATGDDGEWLTFWLHPTKV